MKIIITACCLLIGLNISAQDSIKNNKTIQPAFQSIIQGGLLAGEEKSAYQVQSINGLKYKTFFAGAGVGIDNYIFRSIPVFLDVRKDVFNRPNTPFVFADAGLQFEWVTDGQKTYYYYDESFKGRLYFNAGAGYKINMLRRNALVLSAAFSMKRIDVTYNPYCDFVACPEQLPVTDKYTLRRLSLMLGWSIW